MSPTRTPATFTGWPRPAVSDCVLSNSTLQLVAVGERACAAAGSRRSRSRPPPRARRRGRSRSATCRGSAAGGASALPALSAAAPGACPPGSAACRARPRGAAAPGPPARAARFGRAWSLHGASGRYGGGATPGPRHTGRDPVGSGAGHALRVGGEQVAHPEAVAVVALTGAREPDQPVDGSPATRAARSTAARRRPRC